MSDTSPRVALVVGAPADDLAATPNDCDRVFKLLTHPDFGGCDKELSRFHPECQSMSVASEALQDLLANWSPLQQLLFYVTGHGIIENDSYSIQFGGTKKTYWRFPAILEELKAKNVTRAVLILDTCHSGAALATKGRTRPPTPAGESNYPPVSKGVCILSACRELEAAHELSGGEFSVYTNLLCEGIESGLGGEGQDEFLEVVALHSFINRQLQTPKYSQYRQRAAQTLRNAEGPIWVSRNPSYRKPAAIVDGLSEAAAIATPAIIVVADVIDFFFCSPTEQHATLRQLWKTATEHALVATASATTRLDLMADRMIAVFFEPSGKQSRVLDFAGHLLRAMAQAGTTLRLAIHAGQVASGTFGEANQLGRRHYGRGINEALRILEVCDAGEIIVSEEFAELLKPANGAPAPLNKRFVPELASEADPIHVFGKVEVQQAVRLYRWRDDEDPRDSRLVVLLAALDDAIVRHLEEMEVELLAGLKAKAPKLTCQRLKARVSLLAPQRDDSRRMLRSTAFRVAGFAKPGEKRRLLAPGRTTYSVDPPGTGPAGLAFVQFAVFGLFGLPDYDKKPDEYVYYLNKETGLPPRSVNSLGRHARSFLCLPIGLVGTAPDLVVCIDCMHPLNSLDGLTDVALITVESIRARHNESLAALWRVRCST